jgi:hypothetical protein
MYEIWLVMNIVWEIALGVWPLLLLAALAWAGVMALAWRKPGSQWRRALPVAVGVAAVAAAVAFLGVPAATRSSLQELAYWVDWVNLGAIALAVGAVALAIAWPVGTLLRSSINKS